MSYLCASRSLKAIYAEVKNDVPPRTHNLVHLVELLEIKISEEEKDFLLELNRYYIASRYPVEQGKMAKQVNKKIASYYFKKTGGSLTWLKRKLISKT